MEDYYAIVVVYIIEKFLRSPWLAALIKVFLFMHFSFYHLAQKTSLPETIEWYLTVASARRRVSHAQSYCSDWCGNQTEDPKTGLVAMEQKAHNSE